MSERHWVESLYDTFMLRDLVGYAGPGSILIMGVLCEFEKNEILKSVFASWTGIVFLILSSYIVATGLRILGNCLFLVVFHRESGILGRAWNIDLKSECKDGECIILKLLYWIECLLWRRNVDWLRKIYSQISKDKLPQIIARESVFMHLTGHTAMSLLALSVVVPFLKQTGLSKLWTLSECTIIIVLILLSFIFLVGHYRHAYQLQVLKSLQG